LPGWQLIECEADGRPTGRALTGRHESVLETEPRGIEPRTSATASEQLPIGRPRQPADALSWAARRSVSRSPLPSSSPSRLRPGLRDFLVASRPERVSRRSSRSLRLTASAWQPPAGQADQGVTLTNIGWRRCPGPAGGAVSRPDVARQGTRRL
jgi:hypothetical protein